MPADASSRPLRTRAAHALPLLAAGLLAVLLAAEPAHAQPAEARRAFETGNQRYAEGDYEAALREYEAALESEWTSGALHYNVAGAHYRLGHLGAAVQHYEKASALLPGRARLRHNLSVVRSQTEAPTPVSRPFLARATSRVRGWVPPLAAFALGAALFAGALVWWVQAGGSGPRFRPPGRIAGLMAAGLSVAALGLLLSAPAPDERAVALRGPLALRAAPAAGADSTAALPEGTVLRLTAREGGWARVRSSRGDEGWTRADDLGTI